MEPVALLRSPAGRVHKLRRFRRALGVELARIPVQEAMWLAAVRPTAASVRPPGTISSEPIVIIALSSFT